MSRRHRPAAGQLTYVAMLSLVGVVGVAIHRANSDNVCRSANTPCRSCRSCRFSELRHLRQRAASTRAAIVAAIDDPAPPAVVARGRPPAPRPTYRPTWRPRRARNQARPPEATMDRKVNRFVRRGAHRCLCRAWPAPGENWVAGRIMLTCHPVQGRRTPWPVWRKSPSSNGTNASPCS
jgi:hypothetical protein